MEVAKSRPGLESIEVEGLLMQFLDMGLEFSYGAVSMRNVCTESAATLTEIVTSVAMIICIGTTIGMAFW